MKEGRFSNINISTGTLVKVVVVAAIVYLAYLIADIIALLFVSLILSSAIEPFVKNLERIKIPRALAILLIYLVLFLIVGLSVYLIIPPIINESKDLGANLPNYVNQLSNFFFKLENYTQKNNWPLDLQSLLNNLTSGLQVATQGLFSAMANVFGGIFSFLLVLVLTFYMTMEEAALRKSIKLFFPGKNQNHIFRVMALVQEKIGWWFRGQIALCFIIFLMTYMSLLIFGVKYALVLAIIAGVFEIVPYLGPTLSAIPAVLVTLIQSPLLALFVLFIYIIIQLVENNILVPKVMQKAIGLDPIISLAALMIGFKLGGVMGAIISIPVATAVSVIIKDLLLNRKLSQ